MNPCSPVIPIDTQALYDVSMGLVHSKVVLRNPRLPDLAEAEVDVLVDSGAGYLSLVTGHFFLLAPAASRHELVLEQAALQRAVV